MPVSKKFRKQKKRQTEQTKVAESIVAQSSSGNGVAKPADAGAANSASSVPSAPTNRGDGKSATARQRRNRRIAQEQCERFTALFGEDACSKIAPGDRAAFFSRLKRAEEQDENVSPGTILRQMIDRRTLYRAAGETLINAYPGLDFRRMTAPLTVGTGDFLIGKHPAIPSDFIGQFLSWVTSRPCYLDMVARGVPRRSLDGETVEPILPEHRKNAVLALKRAARGPHKKVASFRSFRYFYKQIPRTLKAM